jgi:hypothetical protein
MGRRRGQARKQDQRPTQHASRRGGSSRSRGRRPRAPTASPRPPGMATKAPYDAGHREQALSAAAGVSRHVLGVMGLWLWASAVRPLLGAGRGALFAAPLLPAIPATPWAPPPSLAGAVCLPATAGPGSDAAARSPHADDVAVCIRGGRGGHVRHGCHRVGHPAPTVSHAWGQDTVSGRAQQGADAAGTGTGGQPTPISHAASASSTARWQCCLQARPRLSPHMHCRANRVCHRCLPYLLPSCSVLLGRSSLTTSASVQW